MKKGILLLTISFVAISAQAQSLKDLLYSGKLKKDSNTVIRKTDDLNSKIDTVTKKPEAEAAKPTTAAGDSAVKKINSEVGLETEATTVVADTAVIDLPSGTASSTTKARSHNQLWKEYIDSLSGTLKTEVLTSKKIKKETYYLYVDYEIGTEGQVEVTNVTATPENAFLQEQVKARMLHSAPVLTPVLDSNGKPRKVKRKYNFNITKE